MGTLGHCGQGQVAGVVGQQIAGEGQVWVGAQGVEAVPSGQGGREGQGGRRHRV